MGLNQGYITIDLPTQAFVSTGAGLQNDGILNASNADSFIAQQTRVQIGQIIPNTTNLRLPRFRRLNFNVNIKQVEIITPDCYFLKSYNNTEFDFQALGFTQPAPYTLSENDLETFKSYLVFSYFCHQAQLRLYG